MSRRTLTVTCTARLHLGFFDLEGGLGRRFGSIGLSLDQPVTRLVVRRSDVNRVRGPEQARVARYLAQMCSHLGLTGQHDVTIEQAMPPHAGLGSGTQLALAVAAAVRRLHGRAGDPQGGVRGGVRGDIRGDPQGHIRGDLRGDAAVLGRGARSGIGIGLFGQGGLVIDGGKGRLAEPPPLLARAAMPEAWRVLLVMDRNSEGLSGLRERAAFDSLGQMDAAVSGAICRLVLMQALPALAEQDLGGFGSAITAIQAHVGDYFAPSQGGRFTSPDVGAALRLLAEAGATGIGQSSWGPTGFAFAADEREARRFAGALEAGGVMKHLDLLICRVLNRGASVDVT
jgi:predicted sugar kinase